MAWINADQTPVVREVCQNGQPSHLIVTVSRGYTVFLGTLPLRAREQYHLGTQSATTDYDGLLDKLQRIPDERIYPSFDGNMMTQFSTTSHNQAMVFLKAPSFLSFPTDDTIAQGFQAEAEMHELLLRNPHSNLVKFLGCLEHAGRVVRLAFDKYRHTLLERKRTLPISAEQIDAWMTAITSAASHLHQLGYAHNDISPANIMFNEGDVPILIDLDCSTPIGNRLSKGGLVAGWRGSEHAGQRFHVSSIECDLMSIGSIRDWLQED
ncbi:kinase-like domain-containing protein [Microdochium bolleyi]|uniref:Kinase-like domain-containing protein n=1 Tax=Microdochium bolleyi TaxID=196109 RepID=A0A136IJS9_9PEZI|nr:kinase-like domain-containing protein [Microdochium bolleyi]